MRTNTRFSNLLPFCVLLVMGSAGTALADVSLREVLDAVGHLQSDAVTLQAVTERLGGKRGEDGFAALAEALRASAAGSPSADKEAIEFFESRVRPILAEHCYGCHGPEKQKNDLRLDSREAALHGGQSGAGLVAGDPSGSLLIQAVEYGGERKMPPEGKLPDESIAVLRHWIEIGAPWPAGETPAFSTMERRIEQARSTHWAFLPITLPEIPLVQDGVWVRTPVDAFVLAALASKGIAPSPSADKYTLIRRVTYDLTGLPPTPEEVAAFVTDNESDAYGRLVERLLASPRYGERWGRFWLDIARYADTRGYVFQSERNIPYSYTYRDYVIRAFNEDLPYDTFIRQQIAADQLDLGEDKRPLAALGFLTLNRHFLGNVNDIVDDRIDVVTRGLMGLTVACARCHDHKYDPVPTEDYYSLYGVFRSSKEPEELPLIKEPDPANPQYQDYVAKLTEAEVDERALEKSLHVQLLTHAREEVEAYLVAAFDTRDTTDEEQFKTVARDRKLRWQLIGRWRDYLKKASESPNPIFDPWKAFAALAPEKFEQEATSIATQVTSNQDPGRPVNPRIAAAFQGDAPKSMPEVALRYAKVFHEADAAWLNQLAAETRVGADASLSASLPDPALEAVRGVLYGPDSPANIAEGDVLAMYDVPTQGRVREKQNAVARIKSTHPGRPDRAMALADADTPYEPHVFKRGNAQNPGDAVPRQFLALLTNGERKPFTHGSGRLEMANAIASQDNPLTARVWVNRVWMNHFDHGIVETPSDFGVRTEKPAYAALLDYLAWHFVHEGWSTKALHRMIVLSNTYQQASMDVPASRGVDSDNRLLWRQNRKRLDFEALRDSLLASAGTLDLTMGGPSVDIVSPPFTTRRTVYSFIERQNLPGMFRTFDFASPDTHSPRRFKTTVPQQALFMLNSPFVIEQAKQISARPELVAISDVAGRVKAIYRTVYQREPDAEECALAERYLADQAEVPSAPARAWQYGYGRVDEATGGVAEFTPYPVFENGEWRAGAQIPDPVLRYVSLRSNGGHPGADAAHASIRRWLAPRNGVITCSGRLKHGSGEGQGDGVIGYIVSSRTGLVWKHEVANTELSTDAASISVTTGDTIDFVVACGANDGWDSFVWAPVVRYEGVGSSAEQVEWRADTDFDGPLPPALNPWERYAQVLIASNEYAFVD